MLSLTLTGAEDKHPKEIPRWKQEQGARPNGEHADKLLRMCARYGINWRKYSKILPVYDFRRDYAENLENGPQGIPSEMDFPLSTIPTQILGYDLNSFIGIPASVLTLSSDWILPYSQMGFDILTYKTCRTLEVSAHTFPNISFLHDFVEPLRVGNIPGSTRGSSSLPVHAIAQISMANSFGMPSLEPKKWQEDIEKTLKALSTGQILIVSIVGTIHDGIDLIDDFVECARLAWQVKPHAIELNFSCPNVYAREEGSIYSSPDLAGQIVGRIRKELPDAKILIKTGYLRTDKLGELFKATYKKADGYTAINTIPIEILSEKGEPVFPSKDNRRKKAGVSGHAIKSLALDVVRQLRKMASESKPDIVVLGTGGVSSVDDVRQMQKAGADGVLICTAALLNPYIAVEIRKQLIGETMTSNRSNYLGRGGMNVRFTEPEIGQVFDTVLEICQETKTPFDIAWSVVQREWVDPFLNEVHRISAGATFQPRTRRQVPQKPQILDWLRNAPRKG